MNSILKHGWPRLVRSVPGTVKMAVILACLASTLGCAHQSRSTILFDEGHGQQFLMEKQGPLDLSALSGLFRDQGLDVKASSTPMTDDSLAHVEALVVSGPFVPFTLAETDAVTHFVQNGGRLCVMLHIAAPVGPLLRRMNVVTSNGVIREREHVIDDDPLNFHVTSSAAHELTAEVPEFDAFGVWALLNTGDSAAVVAQTSASAWVDLNGNQSLDPGDAVQPFAVVIAGELGRGRFVVFGDDAIFQNKFLSGGNAILGRNLVKWLAQKK